MTFAKTSGTVTRDSENLANSRSSVSPVTIPEPTAGLISAVVPFFILKPRVQTDATDIAGCYRMLRPFAHPVACCCVLLRKV